MVKKKRALTNAALFLLCLKKTTTKKTSLGQNLVKYMAGPHLGKVQKCGKFVRK